MATDYLSIFDVQDNSTPEGNSSGLPSSPAAATVTKPREPHLAPVPENNFQLTDAVTLQLVEDIAGGVRTHELRIGDAYLPGKFDAAHLRDFHAYIMQDIYAEPGATRTDELLLAQHALKSTPGAAPPPSYTSRLGAEGQVIPLLDAREVNARLAQLSAWLNQENCLGGLDKPEFVSRLAGYYLAYSQAYPFRTGNEHVLRAVLHEIGVQAGYTVKVHAAGNLRQVTDALLAAGVTTDKTPLLQVFSRVIEPGSSREATLRRSPTQWAMPVQGSPR